LNRTILVGDVLEQLKRIPEKSIDCVITSPPYWGLRDYGEEGQWGLEPDFRVYLEKMMNMMWHLKRILKDTGTVWINLGDSYSANRTYQVPNTITPKTIHQSVPKNAKLIGIPEKSRLGIPERFYIMCIDENWIARNHISWYKSNSMPSSVKDRFTNKWESIFFFAKQQKYYFNLDAVREKSLTDSKPFNIRVRENITGHAQAKLGDRSWTATDEELETHNEKGERKQDNTLGADGKPKANYKGFNERWNKGKLNAQPEGRSGLNYGMNVKNYYIERGLEFGNPNGKNPGDVFFINPRPFPEAHFATFPVDLPLKILKCACPDKVCKKCGKPRNPLSKPTEAYQKIIDQKAWRANTEENWNPKVQGNALSHKTGHFSAEYVTVGYTDCGCNAGWDAGIVLDPFFGAGTVGIAAEKLGLQWVGIELKQEYVDIAKKRLLPYMNERLFI